MCSLPWPWDSSFIQNLISFFCFFYCCCCCLFKQVNGEECKRFYLKGYFRSDSMRIRSALQALENKREFIAGHISEI